MSNTSQTGSGIRRRRVSLVAAVTGVVSLVATALAMAAPAAAAVDRFSFTDPATTEVFPCGAVWTYTGEHTVTLVTTPNTDTEYFRWVQQDYYPGTITYQGTSYTANDRQVHIRYINRDDVPIGVLNGQGLFTHLPGIGVALYDVGHRSSTTTRGRPFSSQTRSAASTKTLTSARRFAPPLPAGDLVDPGRPDIG